MHAMPLRSKRARTLAAAPGCGGFPAGGAPLAQDRWSAVGGWLSPAESVGWSLLPAGTLIRSAATHFPTLTSHAPSARRTGRVSCCAVATGSTYVAAASTASWFSGDPAEYGATYTRCVGSRLNSSHR